MKCVDDLLIGRTAGSDAGGKAREHIGTEKAWRGGEVAATLIADRYLHLAKPPRQVVWLGEVMKIWRGAQAGLAITGGTAPARIRLHWDRGGGKWRSPH